MKTTEFVIGKTESILAYYKLPPVDARNHYQGECPMCGRKGKLRIDDKEGSGSWICVCGSGNLWQLLEQSTGKDFKTLAREIDDAFGNSYTKDKNYQPVVNDRLQQSVNRFRQINKISGTYAENYLNNRGITEIPTGGVKYSDSEYNSDTKNHHPAMYAIASNEYGEAIQRHLTYLDGDKKADVPRVKKMLTLQEYAGPISVKLFQSKSTLGIAEGIETALSAHQIYKMPVWSVLNSSLMKRFKAPPGVNTLVIYADNDSNGTGLSAAFECANKNILSRNDVIRVVVRWPELEDFNDMLLEGCKTYEWCLSSK